MELMDSASKMTASTFINGIDASTPMFACLYFMYVDNNVESLLQTWYYIGCIIIVLYVVFIPESPRWQFMKDSKSKDAIRNLNYIAWFNGSKYRVPNNAVFNFVDEDILNNSVMVESTPRMKFRLNASIEEVVRETKVEQTKAKQGFSWEEVMKQLKKLYCNIRYMGASYRLMVLYIFLINIYYFGLYNAS